MTSEDLVERVTEAAAVLEERFGSIPETGIVLGSGAGGVVEALNDVEAVPYAKVPGMDAGGVEGHGDRFVCGTLGGERIIAMEGRVHYYESGAMDAVVFPVRVLARCGVERVLATTAVGAVDDSLEPGDLVLVTDHINNMGDNPLLGTGDAFGPRFPDMSAVYPERLRAAAKDAAEDVDVELVEGVYLANAGPAYETPAEVEAARTLGADLVGMSVVPEATAASQMGVDMLVVAIVTNLAAGVSDTTLSHDEVLEVVEDVRPALTALITGVVARL